MARQVLLNSFKVDVDTEMDIGAGVDIDMSMDIGADIAGCIDWGSS